MKILPQEVFLHGLGKFPDYSYSLDISWNPSGKGPPYVVTGGADSVARVWTVGEKSLLEIHSELFGHQLGVNCVRFSPDGLNSIATASDDGKIVVWRCQSVEHEESDDPKKSVRWVQGRVLNVLDEVVGMAWSPCGTMIAAALQREMTHIFSATSGKLLARLDGHTNRVTGVAWDPRGQLVVSQSTDRTSRVFARKKNGSWYPKALLKEVSETPKKCQDVLESPKNAPQSKWKLFISESHYPTDPTAHFFRRPEFSPDGSMVVLPGGLSDEAKFVTHLYSRKSLTTNQPPTATFTSPCAPSICARFHPRPFRDTASESKFFVYVVTTVSSFYVMRSDKATPVAFGTDIHCTSIVDASWSSDAQILGLCSTDGYITLIRFEKGELGGTPEWEGFVVGSPLTAEPKAGAGPVPPAEQLPIHTAATEAGPVKEKRRITPVMIAG